MLGRDRRPSRSSTALEQRVARVRRRGRAGGERRARGELELAVGDLGRPRTWRSAPRPARSSSGGPRPCPAAARGSRRWSVRRRGRPRRRGRGRRSSSRRAAQITSASLDLGPVGGPARGDVADVLVGVRVADHHLLLVADRAQRRAVDGLRQQRVHRRRRRLRASRRPRTAARSAARASRRRRAARLALLHQQQHLEQVGRALGAGDDVGLDRAAVGAGERVAQHPEGLDRLPRARPRSRAMSAGISGRRSAMSRRSSAIRSLLAERRVVRRQIPSVAKISASERRWTSRVLADVEAREVKAEHLDLADHVVQVAGGGERPARRRAASARRGAGRRAARPARRSRRRSRRRVARTRSRTKVSARR